MNSGQISQDLELKIIIVGDSGVGKTSIFSKFIKGELPIDDKPTLGIEYNSKKISVVVKGKTYNVTAKIWDTAGQERYRQMRQAKGAIAVYDITKKKTFDNAIDYLHQLPDLTKDNPEIIVVGNKVDLLDKDPSKRAVGYGEAKTILRNLGLEKEPLHLESSAKYSQDEISIIFTDLIKEIINRNVENIKGLKESSRPTSIHLGKGAEKNKNRSCC